MRTNYERKHGISKDPHGLWNGKYLNTGIMNKWSVLFWVGIFSLCLIGAILFDGYYKPTFEIKAKEKTSQSSSQTYDTDGLYYSNSGDQIELSDNGTYYFEIYGETSFGVWNANGTLIKFIEKPSGIRSYTGSLIDDGNIITIHTSTGNIKFHRQ